MTFKTVLAAAAAVAVSAQLNTFVQCRVSGMEIYTGGLQVFMRQGFGDTIDVQEAGYYTLYKNTEWKGGWDVQMRVEHKRKSPTDPEYNEHFWPRGYAMTGDWLCADLIEVNAYPPEMRITVFGDEQTFVGWTEIETGLRSLSDVGVGCPEITANIHDTTAIFTIHGEDLEDPRSGPKVQLKFSDGQGNPEISLNDKWLEMVVQIWKPEENFLEADIGMCPRNGDYTETLPCEDTMFTANWPIGDECAPECGAPGKNVRKGDGTKVDCRPWLNDSKFAETACNCKAACEVAGGTEFMWKVKTGRCLCFKDANKVVYNENAGKRIVGQIEGSTAEAVVQG